MAERKESAADITVSISGESEVVVSRLSLTKNIDISELYGSGRVYPDGYSIDQVSYQGSMELNGNRLDLEEQLFDDNGIPVEATINVTHFDGTLTSFKQVLCTSDGWEMNEGETTSTSFDIIAMGKESGGRTDSQP